jgi:hypothetical protein
MVIIQSTRKPSGKAGRSGAPAKTPPAWVIPFWDEKAEGFILLNYLYFLQ